LAQLQAFRKCSKRTLLAGLTCKTNHELLTFAKQFSIPASLSMLQAAPSTALVNAVVPTALYVPMDALSYSVHGTCFTGKIQIGWIGQLVGRPKHFVLHVDGKYKLHHHNLSHHARRPLPALGQPQPYVDHLLRSPHLFVL